MTKQNKVLLVVSGLIFVAGLTTWLIERSKVDEKPKK
jgi:hypothetical protein